MDPLSVTVSVTALVQLATTVVGYLNDVRNAPKECQQCTLEAMNLLSLLTSLRYRLEEAHNDDPWYTAVKALNVENGPLDQCEQALIELGDKVNVTDASSKLKRRLVWKFSKAEVANILTRIERLKSLVSVALENDHFKLSEAMNAKMDALSITTQAIKENTDTVRSTQHTQQSRAVLDWLSSHDPTTELNDILTRKQEGTGQWFFDSLQIKTWQQGHEKTLFCPGIPGAGKTMLAAIAVDWLSNQAVTDSIAVAYVFCNYKARAQQDTGSLFATLLKQLGQQGSQLDDSIQQIYKKNADGSRRPSSGDILSTLRSVSASFDVVYIVVDALDECRDTDGTRTMLIDRLLELQTTDVRLLLTSRMIPEIMQRFQSCLQLEIRATEQDVRRFVSGQIPRLPKCIQRSEELKTTVIDKIVDTVDGMFLLARLHVDTLLDKRVKQKVLSTLEHLSHGSSSLDAAYDEAIKRIDGQMEEDALLAKRAMSWIYLAKRPLTTTELCIALSIEPGDKALNVDNVNDVEDIITVCGGLVASDEQSGVIRLVHYTTQEYFERKGQAWYPDAQRGIATTCLACLLFDMLPYDDSVDNEENVERWETDNPLFEYAACHWGEHVRPVEADVDALALTLLSDATKIDSFVQRSEILNWTQGYENDIPAIPGMNGLHLTAFWNLPHLIQKLLQDQRTGGLSKINAEDEWDQTPLHFAASRGCTAVVRLLLACDDIKADAEDMGGETPLLYAAHGGHAPV